MVISTAQHQNCVELWMCSHITMFHSISLWLPWQVVM